MGIVYIFLDNLCPFKTPVHKWPENIDNMFELCLLSHRRIILHFSFSDTTALKVFLFTF